MAEDKEQYKKSIRFFNDREVRAVWDEEHSKWWFSATDIVRVQVPKRSAIKECPSPRDAGVLDA